MAKPRKPTLSPTRIATYLECAMKYRYIYHDKIGRFYLRAKPYYSLGTTLHQVLQQFHAEGGVQSAEQLNEQLERSWISAGYQSTEQEDEYRAAGAQMVEAYHAAASVRAEQQAETFLTEKQIKTDMGSFILAGRIDRVDRYSDGSLEIVDYKSGRMTTTPEEVAGDLAMSIYQLILRRNYPSTRVFATIYCLRSGVQASAEMTDAAAEEFAADIIELGNEIISRDFEGVEPVRKEICEECDFLAVCQRFWRQQARSEA